MFLLPPRLRQFFEKQLKVQDKCVFSKDELLVGEIRKIAADHQRGEKEVYNDNMEAGIKVLRDNGTCLYIWESLSPREQEATALTCLGYRSNEIAETLGVSYETIRAHSKHVYAKFNLGRKELCIALKD